MEAYWALYRQYSLLEAASGQESMYGKILNELKEKTGNKKERQAKLAEAEQVMEILLTENTILKKRLQPVKQTTMMELIYPTLLKEKIKIA